MVDVNKKKKTKKKKEEEEEETGGEGRKEGRKEGRNMWMMYENDMFTLVSWLLLAWLLLGKTLFNGSEVLGKSKVVGKQRRKAAITTSTWTPHLCHCRQTLWMVP